MDGRRFDGLTMSLTTAGTRRGLLGVASGAAVAFITRPLRASAGNDPHDGGGGGNNGKNKKDKKGKKDKKKKQCRKLGQHCLASVAAYCQLQYPYPFYSADVERACYYFHQFCCGYYKDCKVAEGDQCIQGVPY